ncbi:hypothetical protein KAW18_11680 [candidate division WOR-3 bacterium]|nr:hypothetical protein [candidate division WOR-3 bacterium]
MVAPLVIIAGVGAFIVICGFLYTSCKYIDLESERVENETSSLDLKHDYINWLKSKEGSGEIPTDKANEILKLLAGSGDPYKEEMSIWESIADTLGVSTNVAKFIIIGIIVFLLLKG